MAYENPLPVVVVLVPVTGKGFVAGRGFGRGVLLVSRADGGFALPGGYMEVKHGGWRESAKTEMLEETGIEIDPTKLSLIDAFSTVDSKKLLLFCKAEPIPVDHPAFEAFKPNSEVLGLDVWWPAQPGFELKFDLHRKIAEEYLCRQIQIEKFASN